MPEENKGKEVQALRKIAEHQKEKTSEETEEKESSEEKMNVFFEKIAFLNLPPESKEEISTKISKESEGDALYWIEIILSSLIATFGLLQNSVAVIIGAMLIAPLLRPIQGLGFGMTTGQPSHLGRSSKLLLKSFLLSVIVAYFFTLLVPLRSETTEILARTAPNLLDFFIAVASGILALLALYYKQLSESIAGVAMAAALMPPLAVIGIELAMGQYDLAWGSCFLFLTNLFAILVVSMFMFLFYGFYPHQSLTQLRTLKNAFILFIVIAIISIPLFTSLINIADKIQVQQQATSILTSILAESIESAKLDELELIDIDEKHAQFFGTIKIADTDEFFLETREILKEALGRELDREVTLELEIIPIASIVSIHETEKELKPNYRQLIQEKMRFFINQIEIAATIIDIDVVEINTEKLEEDEEDTSRNWAIKSVLGLPSGVAFSEEIKQELELNLRKNFPLETFTFFWTPLSQKTITSSQAEESENEKYLKEITLKWETFVSKSLPTAAIVQSLDVSWELGASPEETSEDEKETFDINQIERYYVHLDLLIPDENSGELRNFESRMRRFARPNFHKPSEITIRAFPYSSRTFTAKPPLKSPFDDSGIDPAEPEST